MSENLDALWEQGTPVEAPRSAALSAPAGGTEDLDALWEQGTPVPEEPPPEVAALRQRVHQGEDVLRTMLGREPTDEDVAAEALPDELETVRAVHAGGDAERRAAYLAWQAQHSELTREQAASAVKIAAATNRPVDLVLKGLPTFEAEQKARGTDWQALAQQHPELADILTEDPARFALVKDASAALSGLHDTLLGRWDTVTASQAAQAPDAPPWVKDLAQKQPDAMVAGGYTLPPVLAKTRDAWRYEIPLTVRQTAQALTAPGVGGGWLVPSDLGEARQEGAPIVGPARVQAQAWARTIALTPDFFDPTGAERARLGAELVPPSSAGWRAANQVEIEKLQREVPGAKDYGDFSRTIAGRALYAPFAMSRFLALNAAAGAAGAAAGGPVGAASAVFAYNFAEAFGPLTYELQQTKGPDGEAMDPGLALSLGALGAGASAAAMTMPLTSILKKLPGVQGLIEGATMRAGAEILAAPATKEILWRALQHGGADLASGAAGMGVAAAANRAAQEAARMSVDPAHRFDWQSVLADGVEAGKSAIVDFSALLLAGGANTVLRDRGARSAARESQATIADLQAKGAKLEDLVKAAPAESRRILASLSDGSLTSTVYADLEGFQRYCQGAKIDPRQLAGEVLGDGGKAYDAAVAEHADRLAIPTADFLTKLTMGEGAKHGEALAQDLATGPATATPRQAAAEAKARAARFKELKDVEPAKMEADHAQVFQAYRDQALAAGEAEKVATANAQLYSAALQTLAERAGRGETAMDLWRENPLHILRGEATPAGLPLAAQGARLAQEGLPEASKLLTERWRAMSPEERAREFYLDRNAGTLNERAFRALPPDPARPLVGHISVEGTKWLQDHPDTGHAAGDLLYRATARALHSIDPEAAKVGGDFAVRVKDAAHLEQVVRELNAKLPEGFTATGVAGETFEAAGAEHGKLKAGLEPAPLKEGEARLYGNGERLFRTREEAEAAGGWKTYRNVPEADVERALAEGGGEAFTRAPRGERPLGVGARQPTDVRLPDARAEVAVPEALAARHAALSPEEAFRSAYVEPSGVLTAEGWSAIPRKEHQASLDLNGLKFFNERLGTRGGDAILEAFAAAARDHGGADLDFARLHGDEYAAQSHDQATLDRFLAHLESVSDNVRLDIEAPDGVTYEVQGFQFGRGVGKTNAEAEAGLAAHKLDLTAAGKRGPSADVKRLRALSPEETEARTREDQGAREDGLQPGRGAPPAGRGRSQDFGGLPGAREEVGRLKQGGQVGNIEGAPLTFHKEGDRGFIDVYPAKPAAGEPVRFDLHLLFASDKSTLAHESFHGLSVLLGQLATREDAPAGLRAEYQKLLDAMGYKDHAERSAAPDAAKEEKAAHLWEMYLAEGKAPSADLLTAFARFKTWITRIYRGAVGIQKQYRERYGQELQLSDDVRALFGRLLAGEDAVRDAAREQAADVPRVTLTPEDQATSDQLLSEARARAEADLQHQMAEETRKTDRAFMREARAKVEDATAARLEGEDPVFRAQSALERGELDGLPMKLDAAAVRETLGAEVAKGLPADAIVKEGGLPPDAVAELLGFDSGAELVRQLTNAEPRADRLKRETTQRMAELYPRLQDRPGVLRDAAAQALQNNALLKDGLLRLRAMEREAGLPPTRADVDAIRRAAEQAVQEKTIAGLSPGRFDAAAKAHARRASEVKTPELRRDAFEAYLFNVALAKAAREALAKSEKTARFLQRFTTDAKRAKLGQVTEAGPDGAIGQPYLDQVDGLLDAFELRASATLKEVRSRDQQRAALERWAADRWADGDSVIIPPSVLENLGRSKHWKDLTPREFEDLRDAVESITAQAV